jgi:hypothetical protein
VRKALEETEQWLRDFSPAPDTNGEPRALLIAGWKSRSDDNTFAEIQRILSDVGMRFDRFSYAGPGRPYFEDHTYQSDFEILDRLLWAHLANRPHSALQLLIVHSQAGALATHSLTAGCLAIRPPAALVGLGAALSKESPERELQDEFVAYMENYSGLPSRVCRLIPNVLSLWGTLDNVVANVEADLVGVPNDRQNFIPIDGADHASICVRDDAVRIVREFVDELPRS